MVKTWTAFVMWDGDDDESLEEIDVEADRQIYAKQEVETILRSEYKPGWKIVSLIERPKGFISHLM